MRAYLAAAAVIVLTVVTVRAYGQAEPPAPAAPAPRSLDWNVWNSWSAAPAAAAFANSPAAPPEPEIDVVDARWMALTMWGEARGGGEEAMRAVGHVIDNRRRAGIHGAYVTDTVSEAFQFSCWNTDDPNREAMMNIDALRPGSRDHRQWLLAKRIADEIMSGHSADPTDGALFYHSVDVAPRWSEGVVPVREIGGHLFFRTARQG
jgi:spore germination cell wall hydrolase CwlJ-like protein